MASADFSRDSPSPITPPANTSSTRSDEAQGLQRVLSRLATQRNRRQIARDTMRALAVGAVVCAPLVLLHRLYLLDLATWIPLAILGVALVAGIVVGASKRVGLFEAARDADAALGLEDRLASALSIAQPQAWRDAKTRGNTSSTRFGWGNKKNLQLAPTTAATTSFVPALLHDASTRARSLDPKTVYPQKFDKTTKVCGAALAFLLAVLVMPNIDFLRTPEQKKLASALQQTGKELDQIAKPILKKNAVEADPQTKKLAARMNTLARRMQRGRMSRGEALLGIGELKRDLEKAAQKQKASGSNSDTKRLQDALKNAAMQSDEGKSAKAELQKNDAQKAADQLEKLADKMERGDMTAQDKQKTANDLEKAAKALRENGQPDGAKKLDDAAKALREQAKPQSQQQQGQKQGGEKGGQQQGQQQQGQNPQNQSGQNGQQNQQGQQKNQQNGQNQKSDNQQNGQQGQGQGQKSQNQQGQQNQQGGQKQGQQGSQNGQHNQSGSQGESSTQSPNQQNQSGQQGQSGQSPNGQQGDSAVQGGSQALRDMANGMRGQQGQGQGGGSGNSKNLQDMLGKIKEAERNSGGQNSGQGQGQSGSGSSPSQGEGKSVTPGKDLMPSDPKGLSSGGAGLGPRNNSKGLQSGGGVSKLKSARTGDKRRWADVWSDRLPKTRKGLDKITGKMGANGEMEQLQTQTEAKGGKASAPYYNVYESYKKDAEDAVSREAVPPAYKQPVKDYFESLKP